MLALLIFIALCAVMLTAAVLRSVGRLASTVVVAISLYMFVKAVVRRSKSFRLSRPLIQRRPRASSPPRPDPRKLILANDDEYYRPHAELSEIYKGWNVAIEARPPTTTAQ
jgi:hypothetical protein